MSGERVKMKTSIYFDPETRSKLHDLMKKYQLPMSAIIKIAITKLWEEEVKKFEQRGR